MKTKLFIFVLLATLGISCGKNSAVNPYADVVNGCDKTINLYFDNTKVCTVAPYANSVVNLSAYYERPVLVEAQFVKSNGASASKTLNYTFNKKYNYKISFGSETWQIQPYLP